MQQTPLAHAAIVGVGPFWVFTWMFGQQSVCCAQGEPGAEQAQCPPEQTPVQHSALSVQRYALHVQAPFWQLPEQHPAPVWHCSPFFEQMHAPP
jgi:hypothetical protein